MLLKNFEPTYEFNSKRTQLYVSAMKDGADIRKNELISFNIDTWLRKNPKNIVEIGSGNGYLTKYLSEKFTASTIYATDTSTTMTHNLKKMKNIILLKKDAGLSSLKSNSIDVIFSLATFHHITDKKNLLQEIHRILRTNGLLFIGDVNDGTPTQIFFDTIVKNHCITGHDFDFLSKSWISLLAKNNGFILKDSKIKNVPWIFDNEKQMISFTKKLTGLKISNQKLRLALYENFKITKKDKELMLNWQLGYYVLEKIK